MPYIGKSPTGTGVRSRYYFTASGGETSLSGASDSGATLSFTDGNYVDVSLNGVALVAGTDYNTTTANTIGGLTALSASDIVEILVYDIFTVADTVPASSGGTFSGGVTASSGLNVGTIKEVTGTTTAMTIDSTGRILTPARPAFSGTHINSGGNTGLTGTIIMNTASFNIGNHYDTSTGIFTVPVTGIYRYSFSGFFSTSTGTLTVGQKTVSLQTNASGSFVDYQGMTGSLSSGTGYYNAAFSGLISATAGNQLKVQTIDSLSHIFASTSSYLAYVPRFSIELAG